MEQILKLLSQHDVDLMAFKKDGIRISVALYESIDCEIKFSGSRENLKKLFNELPNLD